MWWKKGNVRLTVYGSHSFIFSERTVFAAEAINEIVAPTGVKAFSTDSISVSAGFAL